MQSSSNLNRFAGKSASFTPMQDDALLKAVEQYKIENEAISVNWKTVLCNLKRMRNGTIDWSQLGHKQLQKRYFHVKNTHAKKLRTQDRNANTHGTAHASRYTLSGLSDEEVELITPPASVEYMFSGVSAKTLLDPAYITSMGFRKRLLDVGITFRKFTELLAQNSGKLPAEWLEKLRNYNKPPLYDETKSFYRSQEKRRNVGIARVAATSSCNQSQQQSPSSHCSSTVVVTNMKGYPKAATSTRYSSERSSGDENILYPLEYKTAVHSDDDDDCVSIVSRSTSKKTNYDEYGNVKYGQMSEQCDAAGLPVDNKMDSKVSLVSEGEKEPEEENALFGKRSSVTMEAGINDKFTELFRTTKQCVDIINRLNDNQNVFMFTNVTDCVSLQCWCKFTRRCIPELPNGNCGFQPGSRQLKLRTAIRHKAIKPRFLYTFNCDPNA
ncbi:unnamed protein product [Orchesella dallaii]|uniref:MADF domain-containing protein n=1 Tax=Orchesella dallaii TaxID=48710 RepID=A0ABP1RAE1_9HEXA